MGLQLVGNLQDVSRQVETGWKRIPQGQPRSTVRAGRERFSIQEYQLREADTSRVLGPRGRRTALSKGCQQSPGSFTALVRRRRC